MSQFYVGVSAGSLPPSVPTSFVTDSGTVVPSANIVNINGGSGIQVVANPNGSNNMVINLTEVSPAYTNVTFAMSPYTVTATDYFISVDATGGAVTINLPDAPTSNRQFIIKDRLGQSAANTITIKSLTGASTIDQQANYTFVDNYESLECLYHSGNYEVF
jgi:hypothetical protein